MTAYLVTHIRRDRGDLDRRIDMLQGPWFGPSLIDDVINDMLRPGGNQYYVQSGTTPMDIAYLEVMRSSAGRLFLRTIPDGLFDNNLYSLPEIVFR
jgi:hypothetical protein